MDNIISKINNLEISKKFKNKVNYYNKNIESIIKIQKWFKQIYNISDLQFFNKLKNNYKILLLKKNKIEYLLNEFGTKEYCNRFDVGNCIEFIICEILNECGLEVDELPNAKRIDLNIKRYKKISIKYSSIGDITLHNSNSCINKDENMTDMLLITCNKIYLLTQNCLIKNKINIKEYLKNTGDSLKLKRKILKKIENINYPYIINFNININKKECKNRLTSKLFYKKMTEEYNKKIDSLFIKNRAHCSIILTFTAFPNCL
jgi:hypothetical protein